MSKNTKQLEKENEEKLAYLDLSEVGLENMRLEFLLGLCSKYDLVDYANKTDGGIEIGMWDSTPRFFPTGAEGLREAASYVRSVLEEDEKMFGANPAAKLEFKDEEVEIFVRCKARELALIAREIADIRSKLAEYDKEDGKEFEVRLDFLTCEMKELEGAIRDYTTPEYVDVPVVEKMGSAPVCVATGKARNCVPGAQMINEKLEINNELENP